MIFTLHRRPVNMTQAIPSLPTKDMRNGLTFAELAALENAAMRASPHAVTRSPTNTGRAGDHVAWIAQLPDGEITSRIAMEAWGMQQISAASNRLANITIKGLMKRLPKQGRGYVWVRA